MHTVRQPVMAGPGDPPALGSPMPGLGMGSRGETPLPSFPTALGLHHCWHPNEKVNIEPKELGVVGWPGAPGKEAPAWDQLGFPRVCPGERACSAWGGRVGAWGMGQAVGPAHCVHRQGAFQVCSVPRSRPVTQPTLPQHLAQIHLDPGPTQSH